MKIKCAECSTVHNVTQEKYGSLVECSACKSLLIIPGLGGEPEPEPTVVKTADEFRNELREELLAEIKVSLAEPEQPPDEGEAPEPADADAGKGALREGVPEALVDSLKQEVVAAVSAQLQGQTPSGPAGNAVTGAIDTAKLEESILAKVDQKLAALAWSGGDLALGAPGPEEMQPRELGQSLAEDVPQLPRTVKDVDAILEGLEPPVLVDFLRRVVPTDTAVYMLEATNQTVDVGGWKKARAWVCVTDEDLIIAARGKREVVETVPLAEIYETIWNEFTQQVVFGPPAERQIDALRMAKDRATHLLSLVYHGESEES